MAEPFLGQIQIVGFNFAPFGWATCDGQLLPITQNTALFAILGTTYGGDGINTFALPNLQGRTPLHSGQGIGLSTYSLGETAGPEAVSLTPMQIGPHTHSLKGDSAVSPSGTPTATEVFGVSKSAKPGTVNVYGPATSLTPFDTTAVGVPSGAAGTPHNNRQPYLGLLFIIAMQGIFPSRN
ncbi:MAG TPA: tail fiber protein [Vicinamibacterales bacterium]|jgi:microcystin-dependent protein|nr:tail fiber protein [Vicinamibacterales bacterium]